MMRKRKPIFIKQSKTVLQCDYCEPNNEINKLNPMWIIVEKRREYNKNFLGVYKGSIYEPQDYNEKLEKLICPFCNSKLIDTGLPVSDFHLIAKASDWNRQVLDLMMELHENDPIEYQLKLNQFKLQNEQAEKIEEQELESRKPHCPICNSTNLKKISGLSKAGSVALWGVFAVGRTSKTWHCNDCDSEW